jgi:Leucine-rich repeat (LRR) protein
VSEKIQIYSIDNQLTEVQLSDFPCLTHFEARANKITQITKLNAPKLQKLYLAQNKIKALNEMSDKKQLQVLHLRDNEIESLDGLSDQMKELRYLNLR